MSNDRVLSTEDRVPSPSVEDRVPSAQSIEYRHRVWKYQVPSPSVDYRVPSAQSIEYRHRVWKYRVPSPSVEYRVPSTITVENRHRVWKYRVLSTECSPSIENHHRVSSTITEYRSMEYRQSPRIEYRHRVASTEERTSKLISICRRLESPSMEYRVTNSKLSRRTSHPSYAAQSNPIPTSKLVKMYEVRVLILQGGIKKGREMTPVDRMDIGKDMGLDQGACNGCDGRRGSS